MSVQESEDTFSDIQTYFTAEEWAKISNYERICIKNVKENYEIMMKAGLQASLPMFMQRENGIMDSGWIQIKEEIKNEEEESDIKSEEVSLDVLVTNQEQGQTEKKPSYEDSFVPQTIKIEALSDGDDDYSLNNDLHSGGEWNSDILELNDLGKAIQSQSSLSDQENQSGDLNTQSCDQKSVQSLAEVAAGGNQTPKQSGDLNTQSCDQQSEQSLAEVTAVGNQTPKQSGDLNTQSCDQKSEQSLAELAAGCNHTPKKSGDLNTRSCDQKSEQSEVAAGGNHTPKQSGDLNTQSCDQKSEQSLAEKAPASLTSTKSHDLNNQSCDLNSPSGDPDIQSCDQSSEQTLTEVGPARNQIPEKPQSCQEVSGQSNWHADRMSHSLLGADELGNIPFSTKEEPEAETADRAEHDTGNDNDQEKLWCICRQPYDERFMICCDKCEDWFHGKCVNVTKKEGKRMERENISWMCPKCTDSGIYRCKYCGSLYAIPLVLARHLKYKHGLSGVFILEVGSRGDILKYSGAIQETSDNINEHEVDDIRTLKSETPNHNMPQTTSHELRYLVRRKQVRRRNQPCKVNICSKAFSHDSGIYRCKYCGSLYAIPLVLARHLKYKHGLSGVFLLEVGSRGDILKYSGAIQETSDNINEHEVDDIRTLKSETPNQNMPQTTSHELRYLVRRKQVRRRNQPYKVNICRKAFSHGKRLTKHKRIHRGKKPYHKASSNNSSSKGHKKIKTQEKPYACDECGKAFSEKRRLKVHKRTHTGEKPYACDECGKAFNEKWTLKLHKRTHTGEKPYACDECGKTFTRKSFLTIHKRTHTGEKPYECDQCGKAFTSRSSLTYHKLVHTEKKPYECDQCGKGFISGTAFKKHTRIHTGERPFECEECGKAFIDRPMLEKHKQIHTGKNPYVCDQCGKEFRSKQGFSWHKLIHTGETPYACDQCGKAFSQTQNLKKHVLTHTDEKPYVCDQCGKAFSITRYLTSHKRIHLNEKPYKCDDCGKTFNFQRELKVHYRIHTGEKPHIC
ncbi:zinc finger protein 43-like isoform X3 [Lytechinus variegatus]|uniref:zinc finger protein 43-like isoform X3 n=1 Tax=Lytechinus variegatus TaxID=7654 RepID=UPI001BB27E38|nr:zinc finger protein 43-like isoform X3 [Lytechinus variegatus]